MKSLIYAYTADYNTISVSNRDDWSTPKIRLECRRKMTGNLLQNKQEWRTNDFSGGAIEHDIVEIFHK